MRDFLERRHILRQNWIFVLGLSLCLYFSYHLIQGERSYIRLIGVRQAIERDTKRYDDMMRDRQTLERRVDMLRPGSINPDYLEERARAVLGYRSPEEMDIVSPK